MLGGKSISSQAVASGGVNFNSSGWVVGGGSANGGSLSTGGKVPFYVSASIGVVILSYFYYRKK